MSATTYNIQLQNIFSHVYGTDIPIHTFLLMYAETISGMNHKKLVTNLFEMPV